MSGRRPNWRPTPCGDSIGFIPLLRGTGARRGLSATTFFVFARERFCRAEGSSLSGVREVRDGYQKALKAADRAWDEGHLDFADMEDYLAALLQAQLEDDGLPYQGASSV